MNASSLTGKPCYWCRRAMLLPMGKDQHPLSATVDHVRSRPECLNKSEYTHRKNKVPACFECNQRRSNEWMARFTTGQVIRTEWAQASKDERRERRAALKFKREQEQKALMEAKCYDHRPGIKIIVPVELSEAWGT